MRRVNPKLYTTEYYLTDCTGYQQFTSTWGQELEPRLVAITAHLPSVWGLKILDIGCGRGELVFWSLTHGATSAVGIDYSYAAIRLARLARSHRPKSLKARSKFAVLDAKHLPFPKHSFDCVYLTEVLEHLYPEEQEAVFSQITRVLKPGGFVFIHTSPSRIFLDYTYRWYCYPVGVALVSLWNTLAGRRYPHLAPPAALRTPSHHLMHVAEPDYFALQRLFTRHGLVGHILTTNITIKKPIIGPKDLIFNFLVYLTPLSNYPPLNILFGNDYYAVLRPQ